MKNLLMALFGLISMSVFAQDNTLKDEMSVINDKEDKLVLFFSSDNWKGLPSEIESKPIRSHGFSFSFMNEVMNQTGTFGLGAGLGFMSQNVHTDGFLTDTTEYETYTMLTKIPDSLQYSLNKLSLNYITVAVELRARTKENSHGERFKFNAGVTAAILVQSHTKYNDKNGKFKTYNVNNLNNYQFGLTARIGYSNYAIAGYYSLTTVFEKNNGVELTPYSIGISLTF